jgi:hypothetical protein
MVDLCEETRLTRSAGNGQDAAKNIELSLVSHREVHSRHDLAESCDDRRVGPRVSPAADGVYWRVLPCLESIVVVEVMSWFPEVEDFVAVLDWAEEGRDQVTCEEDIERSDGTKLERRLFRPAQSSNISDWIQSARASFDANPVFLVAGASRFTSTLVVAGMLW